MNFWSVSRSCQIAAEISIANLTALACVDDGVVRPVGEQGLKNREVEPMAAAIGAVRAEQRQAGERQVAHRIQELVAHELVGEAQAFGVDHTVLADRDGVLQRGAQRETGAPELLDVPHETKGTSA
jgi:hypothetical protein